MRSETAHDGSTATGRFPVLRMEWAEVLRPEAVAFVNKLAEHFSAQVTELLADRAKRQLNFDAGTLPDFLDATRKIRDSDWRIGPIPPDLRDRRVEITGPTDRKMIINALNSGANVFMADCEDSLCPTWSNVIQGQANLMEAVRGTLTYTSPDGKAYRLNESAAVLVLRPRGWHLPEKHWMRGGNPIPAALVDFGLYLFHNASELLSRGSGPYFYLPKLESHLEARLWAQVFEYSERLLGLPRGCIKATVLIETITAAFEIDEILYELRQNDRRAQLRTLGLHLQLHQEILPPPRLRAARP